MLRHFRRLLVLSSFLLPGIAVSAPDDAQTPPVGSSLRAAIMEAARPPVETDTGKPVRFVVLNLAVLDGWAFLDAHMVGPDGKPFSYAGTPMADAAQHGLKSLIYTALLHKERDAWTVSTYRIGPTDVPWLDWGRDYGAPRAIFPSGDE